MAAPDSDARRAIISATRVATALRLFKASTDAISAQRDDRLQRLENLATDLRKRIERLEVQTGAGHVRH